jgi:hypothetical protein
MTATLFSPNASQYTFGQQTNQAIGRLISLNTQLARLGEAITTASTDYDGVPGTQFEAASTMTTPMPGAGTMMPAPTATAMASGQNLFGVIPDQAAPGKEGQTYAYAMARLTEEWTKFWDIAKPFVQQLDNGQMSM